MSHLFDVTFPAGRRTDIIARLPRVLIDIKGLYSPKLETSLLVAYSVIHYEWTRWYFGWNDHYNATEILDTINRINGMILDEFMNRISYTPEMKKRRIWTLLNALRESISGFPRLEFDKHLEDIPLIPENLSGLSGPANYENSCYCDSYIVCMFMSTTDFDVILKTMVKPSDFYAFRSNPFTTSPFTRTSKNKALITTDETTSSFANNMRRYLATLVTYMRIASVKKEEKSARLAVMISDFLDTMRNFGFSVNEVGGQQDIPELHTSLTNALGSFPKWSVGIRTVRLDHYYILPMNEFKEATTGLEKHKLALPLTVKTSQESNMTNIQLIPMEKSYGRVTLTTLFFSYTSLSFTKNTAIHPIDNDEDEPASIRDIESLFNRGVDALGMLADIGPESGLYKSTYTDVSIARAPLTFPFSVARYRSVDVKTPITLDLWSGDSNFSTLDTRPIEISVKSITGNVKNARERREYSLIAIACKDGYTASGGHYVAYVKRNNTWFKFDDLVREFVAIDSGNYKRMVSDTNENGYFFVVNNPKVNVYA